MRGEAVLPRSLRYSKDALPEWLRKQSLSAGWIMAQDLTGSRATRSARSECPTQHHIMVRDPYVARGAA